MNKIKTNNFKKTFIFILFFLSNMICSKIYANENYVLSTVNKLPITKIDVINRAKLIAFSMDEDLEFKNIENFYNQSFKNLINERVIESAGLLINKNINKIVSKQAYQLTLQDFDNSENKLNQFINNLSIPKSAILDKMKIQLIWGAVLRKKFKVEIKNLEEKTEEIIKIQEAQNKKDLYDLAEIVIEKKGNTKLLENINIALKQGSNFLDIAKQVSISISGKFNGKIGWKSYENLPSYIKDKKTNLREGDVFSFQIKDRIRIIKILAKRNKGRLSVIENKVLLAQIKFPINFKKNDVAYNEVKKRLDKLLYNKKNCDDLKQINNEKNKDINLKVVNSRIADLSPNIQKVITNKKILQISKPVYFGNNGFTYIKCDVKQAKLSNKQPTKIKKNIVAKQYLIFSEKLIKKLNKQADIINIEKIK